MLVRGSSCKDAQHANVQQCLQSTSWSCTTRQSSPPLLPLGLAPLASAGLLGLLAFAPAGARGAGAGALSGEKSSRQMGQEEAMNWRPARAASCSRFSFSSSV